MPKQSFFFFRRSKVLPSGGLVLRFSCSSSGLSLMPGFLEKTLGSLGKTVLTLEKTVLTLGKTVSTFVFSVGTFEKDRRFAVFFFGNFSYLCTRFKERGQIWLLATSQKNAKTMPARFVAAFAGLLLMLRQPFHVTFCLALCGRQIFFIHQFIHFQRNGISFYFRIGV